MEIWSGSIAGISGLSQGKGISLTSPSPNSQCDLPKDAKLSIRSFVNPALVPYYARTGPALEVHIRDLESAEWWRSRLLSSILDDCDELDESQPLQCPTGLLLAVEASNSTANGSRNVTDILVYGVLSLPVDSKRPPTPPSSSSPSFPYPEPDHETTSPQRELRTYAVTLCSTLITKAQSLPSPPPSPTPTSLADNEPFAEFLPDLHSPSPKRKRMANLFEAATEYHKKVRRKGGEAVAQLMARSSSSSTSQLGNASFTKIKKEPDTGVDMLKAHKPRTLSISRLTGAITKQPSPGPLAHIRGSNTARTRTSSMSNSRRSTPVPSIKDPALAQTAGRPVSLSQQNTTISPSEIIVTNKALLTRTILTCMRLYGYHRTTKPTTNPSKRGVTDPELDSPVILGPMAESQPLSNSRPSTATTLLAQSTSPDTDEDEDFKAMYHATYRAASFALRRYLKGVPPCAGASLLVADGDGQNAGLDSVLLSVPVLEKERVTDLVDGLLKLFCEGG
ncbi:hypothetical protein FQN50_001787 [Emmonsiellopsis sp. PD_5]|nr:hypothetical protein FQN50_001787 [Emmonsiellopsis sp. PD_5]